MVHSLAITRMISISLLSVIVIYMGFMVVPAIYEHWKMRQAIANMSGMPKQLETVEAQLRAFGENDVDRDQTADLLLRSAVSYDCLQGGYAEILGLTRIYDLTVKVMREEKGQDQSAVNTAAWLEVPIFFTLSGSWNDYVRFKRALLSYPCLAQLTKEQVTADSQPGFIIADFSLSIFKPQSEQSGDHKE